MSQPSSSPSNVQPLDQVRQPTSRLRRANSIALVLALLWLLLIGLTLTPQVDDFKWYWQAGRSFSETGDPYRYKDDPATGIIAQPQPAPNSGGIVAPIFAYGYPPLFAYAMQPLSRLDYRTAQWIWFGLNTLLLGGLIALCMRLSGSILARRYWGILIVIMLVAPPTRLSLQLGQVSILIAVMLVGGLALERRPYLAGLLLAGASWIKLTPIVIAMRYALRRPRAVLWWTIFAGLALLAISLLAYDIAPYRYFFDSIVFGREYPYAAEHNISFYGFWSRLLARSLYAVPLIDAPAFARTATILSSVATLGLCIWATRTPSDQLGNQLVFCLWLCAMQLLSPSNGYYSLVALLLPLLVVLRYLEQCPDRRMRLWLLMGTALACIPPTWSDWQPVLYNTIHTGWGLLMLTPSLYGLLIYTLLLAHLARSYRPTTS
jgi:Glycosyltransferase family 87